MSTKPIHHGASYESTGPATSYTDIAGSYLDLDAGGTFAQVGAKGPGSIGLKLRTVLAGVALTVLTFTSAGVATFLENVNMSGGKTFAAQAVTATSITATGVITGTFASATVYSATNSATLINAYKVSNTTTGAGTNAFIQFYNGANVDSRFGIVQNASGYGDFVWNAYSGVYAEVARLTSAGALTVAAGLTATSGTFSAALSATSGTFTALLSSTFASATAYVATNSATMINAARLGNTTTGTGTNAFLQFYNGANLDNRFGVVQTAAGYGDYVWNSYSGAYAEVGRLTSAGALSIAAGLTATTGAFSAAVKVTSTATPGLWLASGTLVDGDQTFLRLSGTATSGAGIIGRIEFYNSVASEADTAMGNLKFVRDGANNSSAFVVRLVAAGAGVDPALRVGSNGILQVGNAYVAGAPGITGYIIVKDNTGTSYKVSVST